jgi:hypothetical protein
MPDAVFDHMMLKPLEWNEYQDSQYAIALAGTEVMQLLIAATIVCNWQ